MLEFPDKFGIYTCSIYTGSYISAHLFIKFIKRVGKPRILSLFRNEFNKFNNTGAQIEDIT